MSVPNSTEVDTAKAREIWAEYPAQHDVSDRTGQAVGIEPVSGRIWFGRKALDIARQMGGRASTGRSIAFALGRTTTAAGGRR